MFRSFNFKIIIDIFRAYTYILWCFCYLVFVALLFGFGRYFCLFCLLVSYFNVRNSTWYICDVFENMSCFLVVTLGILLYIHIRVYSINTLALWHIETYFHWVHYSSFFNVTVYKVLPFCMLSTILDFFFFFLLQLSDHFCKTHKKHSLFTFTHYIVLFFLLKIPGFFHEQFSF